MCIASANSQTVLSPNVIAAGGGVSKFPGIELEWTLGEASAGTISNSSTLYTVGFHQPQLISKQVFTDVAHTGEVSVYPNPVANLLQVKFNFKTAQQLSLTLKDISGKMVSQKKTQSSDIITEIAVDQFASGVYFLEVKDLKGHTISTFKIIKTN